MKRPVAIISENIYIYVQENRLFLGGYSALAINTTQFTKTMYIYTAYLLYSVHIYK